MDASGLVFSTGFGRGGETRKQITLLFRSFFDPPPDFPSLFPLSFAITPVM